MRRISLLAAAAVLVASGCCAPVEAAGIVAGGAVLERPVAGADGSGERRVIVLDRTPARAAAFGVTPSAAGTVEHNIWPLPLPEAIAGRVAGPARRAAPTGGT